MRRSSKFSRATTEQRPRHPMTPARSWGGGAALGCLGLAACAFGCSSADAEDAYYVPAYEGPLDTANAQNNGQPQNPAQQSAPNPNGSGPSANGSNPAGNTQPTGNGAEEQVDIDGTPLDNGAAEGDSSGNTASPEMNPQDGDSTGMMGTAGAGNLPGIEPPPEEAPPNPEVPPEPTPPPVQPPPAPSGPDIACPADATFCSGFEGAAFPAGTQFQPTYLAGAALGTEMRLDSTTFHSGGQSLHMPAGSNYYRMLAVDVPSSNFWVRLYTRSDVGFGADGSTHASLFMASILEPGGDYNGDRAVEIAEQFDQVLLNANDITFGTTGRTPSGRPGTQLADNAWVCMEAHFDGPGGSTELFVEGEQIVDAQGWDAAKDFKSFRFGYLRFSSPTRDVWADDVVVAASRVGCL